LMFFSRSEGKGRGGENSFQTGPYIKHVACMSIKAHI
jgi:hypothetical protein